MSNVKTITYCDAIRETTAQEMRRDGSVYLIGEDVGRWGNLFGASRGLLEEFGPAQVKDSPISEAAMAGCGIGSAVYGMRPIVEIMYIDFITIAMDQMINYACFDLPQHAAWLNDQGRPCMKEASMVKLFCSETLQKITNDAMQIHGGYGYIMEYPIQRFWRDARLFTVTEGTSEIPHMIIAKEMGF